MAGSSSDPERIAERYSIERRLGSGAFGTVYLATDEVLGRQLAIKTVRLDALAATGAPLEELRQRFSREAQISARLKHPNIVTIYDVGEFEGLNYLAMEYIEGEGLESLIARAGRLPPSRAIAIAAQVAQALGHAHTQGVIHRDVKPANIMIEAGDRVKVTDFGIAKAQTSETLTATGSLVGTPAYMSPEQAKGSPLDGRSDLFSLGCVLYEMLSGARAFQADSITGLIFKVITEPPPPLRELSPETPTELVAVVQKALSKAPETRFPSGEALAEALQSVSGATRASLGTARVPEPTLIDPPGRGATGSGSGTRASSTAPTLAAASGARRPSRPSPPPPSPEPASSPLPWLIGAAAVVALAYWMVQERAPATSPATPTSLAASAAPPSTDPTTTATPPRRVRIAPAPAFTPPPAVGDAPPSPAPGPGVGPAPPPTGGARRGRGGPLEQGERLALGALNQLAQAQGTYFQRNSRYGSLVQLQRAGLIPATTNPQFQRLRKSYRLEVQAGRTSYRAVARAVTSGLRSFEVDETGVVRAR